MYVEGGGKKGGGAGERLLQIGSLIAWYMLRGVHW